MWKMMVQFRGKNYLSIGIAGVTRISWNTKPSFLGVIPESCRNNNHSITLNSVCYLLLEWWSSGTHLVWNGGRCRGSASWWSREYSSIQRSRKWADTEGDIRLTHTSNENSPEYWGNTEKLVFKRTFGNFIKPYSQWSIY